MLISAGLQAVGHGVATAHAQSSELSKTTLLSLMLEQLQFPAPNRNRNRNRNRNPPLCFKGNTRGLRLRLRLGKMEDLGLRAQITISTGFTEV